MVKPVGPAGPRPSGGEGPRGGGQAADPPPSVSAPPVEQQEVAAVQTATAVQQALERDPTLVFDNGRFEVAVEEVAVEEAAAVVEVETAAERAAREEDEAKAEAEAKAAAAKAAEVAARAAELEACKRAIMDSLTLPADERRLLLRKLQIKWHPDNFPGDDPEAVEARQFADMVARIANEAAMKAKRVRNKDIAKKRRSEAWSVLDAAMPSLFGKTSATALKEVPHCDQIIERCLLACSPRSLALPRALPLLSDTAPSLPRVLPLSDTVPSLSDTVPSL